MQRTQSYWLLLCLLLASCSTATKPSQRSSRLSELGYTASQLTPPDRHEKCPGIKVRINDVSTTLLLDSGANATRIEESFAKKARVQLDTRSHAISHGAMGRPVKVSKGRAKLKLGSMTLNPYRLSISKDREKSAADRQFKGQIGADVLLVSGSLVDLSTGTLWTPSENSPNLKGGQIIPLGYRPELSRSVQTAHLSELNHLIVKGLWRGQRLSFIVDTGAESSLLSRRAAKRLGVTVNATSNQMIDTHGDKTDLGIASLASLSFNQLKVDEIRFSVAPLPILTEHFREKSGRPVDGILGIDFLRKHHALIDIKSRLIYWGEPQE